MKILYSVLLCLIVAASFAFAGAASSSRPASSSPLDDLPWGETCADSIPIPYATLPFCTTASTGTAAQNYHVPCIAGPFNTARDAVYCLLVPSGTAGTVTASLCGSNYDSAIHVWRNRHPDAGGTLVGCSNRSCGDDGCVTFLAEADSFYYIIVDGGQGLINDGIYHLNIREGTDCADYPCDSNPFTGVSGDIESQNDSYCSNDIPFLLCGDENIGHVDNGHAGPDTVDYYSLTIAPGQCTSPVIDLWGVPDGPGTFDPHLYVNRLDEGCTSWGLPNADAPGRNELQLNLDCLLPGTYIFGVASFGPGGYYSLTVSCPPCACGTTSLPNFDLDQNNNTCNPNNITITSGDSLWGAITNVSDVDWFNFEVTEPQGEMVSLSLIASGHPGFFTYGQGLNPKIFLYGNQCQTMIANDDNSGLGNDALLGPLYLPQGFYSIKVEGNGSFGPYILASRCTNCPCEACPFPNRDYESVNGSCNPNNPEVHCSASYCGEILNANDLDYYTFIPPQDACTEFTIKVLADDTPNQCAYGLGLDAAIDIYSANCGWQMFGEDFGGIGTDPLVNFSQQYPESAYKIVVRGTGNTAGRYILQIDCQPTECANACQILAQEDDLFDYEYCGQSFIANGCGPEFFSAYPLQCGQAYFGYSDATESFTDTDWYQFTVHNNDGQVYICLESDFDATLSVIAAGPSSDYCWNRDLLNCKIAPLCTFTCDTFCLVPGDYFIEVKPLAPFPVSCGHYRLSMQCADCQPARPAPVQHLTIHFPDNGIVPDPNLTNVVLRWDAVQTADEYLIYRSTNPDPNMIVSQANLISVTTNTFYIDESRIEHNGLTQQTYYAVVANARADAAPCSANP